MNEEQIAGMNRPITVIQPSEKSDLLSKIRPDAIVEELFWNLQGFVLRDGKWIKEPGLETRSITKMCAWDIRNLMLSCSSQNVTISKLTDDEIRKISLENVDTFIEMALKNWQEYGINGTDQLRFTARIVLNNTFVTLKHADGGHITGLVGDVSKEQRVVTEQGQTNSGGILKSLFRK